MKDMPEYITGLKPCPCGETPTGLNGSVGSRVRWRIISGNCCGEREHECRVPTIGEEATREGQLRACFKAWNNLPRAGLTGEQHGTTE